MTPGSISRLSLGVALLMAAGLAAGCSTTISEKPKETPAATGFLGDTYALLTPGAEGQPALRYVNPDVDWKRYRALEIEPVQFWAGNDSKVAPESQQMLTSYFYNKLKEELGKQFKLTDLPGKGVIRLQAAITDVTTATPGLRTVSVVVPQARVLNQAQSLVTGSYAFSGTAEGAMKATDARTGQLLGAAVDRRAGGGALSAAAQWEWGDAKAALDYWAVQTTARLVEFRAQKAAQPR